ncbi:pentatricopeptide repeat-containing protein At3g29290-like [Zingiber officinale]|uniref:pentatricopeptide repeat-containing protein At3g29290-like n=1 Tax=Zingiber officinale TaxID=94328 RepID=UPI001C4B4322|nr:pentatricopeptide repeat-containing protein At3g29290-like [Zingiber officinale]XP_042445981.1 pentatricopeptide repeat-containing protein At3g29290-like [Zingiber officinale]XP_042445982.1 pentatricopeptide repeat-containing protein At3g29290-like [Zingiber officinale]XP_042445983.1 pentatricopeptide repeat-containing protein At3g29290-like [Zingiber officinale]
MVELLRGISIICTAYDSSPVFRIPVKKEESFQFSFCYLEFAPFKQRCLPSRLAVNRSPALLVIGENGRLNRLKPLIMCRMTNLSFCARRDCSASVCYYKSGVTLGEEVSLPIWDQDVSFNLNDCLQEHLPLVTPVIQEELCENIGQSPSCRKFKRLFKLSKGGLHYLEEKDEELLSGRLLVLSRSNKVKSALELFASMEASSLHPSSHACNSLLSSLARNGFLKDALHMFEIMNKKGIATGHTFSLILKIVASVQGANAALGMFNEFVEEGRSRKFDIVVYNTMITICGKDRNLIETKRLWRMLKQNSVGSTMTTYELLVSIFVQCGQFELAVDAYHEMIQSGIEPNENILRAILSSCTKEGNWNLGLSVFQKILDNGIRPNIIAFNSLINCLGKAGKAELAFKVYDMLNSVGHRPDGYTWNALLCALYKSNRHADAIKLFEGIRQEQDFGLNVHLYNTTLMSCQKLGLWDRSLQILWEMENCGIEMSTVSYNHAIYACEVARKPKVALQVYWHMIEQKHTPDIFTYLSLIRSCIWGSLWNDLEEIMESVSPNSSIYNALVHGLCLRGKISVAIKLYKKMRSIGLKPDGKTRALMLQHLPNDRVDENLREIVTEFLLITTSYPGLIVAP